MTKPFRGSLFAEDFLTDAIAEAQEWRDFGDDAVDRLYGEVRRVFEAFPTGGTPNEIQTEQDLIWPVLERLGWTASLRQQNLSLRGRTEVPDGLLLPDDAAKTRANDLAEEANRYALGLAIVEAKRWRLPLDRESGGLSAPSHQMIHYLRRAQILTDGALRWGILSNGALWRLYFSGARSIAEQFLEIDLPAALGLSGELSSEERRRWFKAFALAFRRDSFLPGRPDGRTFHEHALDESRFHERRVAANLSDKIFGQVFPALAGALAAAAPEASAPDVRVATLILLYRLLFILYAEDRNLLPVHDARYAEYALRERVRGDVGDRMNRGLPFSASSVRYWTAIGDLCRIVDAGDAAIGLPPYNGGLFDRERTPLLERIRIGDDVISGVVEILSYETMGPNRHYINYRDLGVEQLGSIYERLLEQEIAREEGGIAVRPNVFARKNTGSYYTPDDLVGVILSETLGPLIDSRLDAFFESAGAGKDELDDPAEAILRLKICDPSMGSGHFLVGVVDYLSDRILAAMADAEAAIDGYRSPLNARIADIRRTVLANAEAGGWTIDPERLDDRHVVRRMVLKRCVYGVDKNPMAVELAKVALWLHTFTVGAPLSFLDHHLRCGDSLFGSWVREGSDRAAAHGSPLLLHEPLQRAILAEKDMETIEELTDAEIAEADRSADVFSNLRKSTAPLDAFLSLVHALEWLRAPDDGAAIHAFFDGQFGDPVDIALGRPCAETADAERFAALLRRARRLMAEERFLNWQVAFPGVWKNWRERDREGGFDAVVGNPPWDRVKLQQVEWFAARKPEIAAAPRAADRKRMIAALEREGNSLAVDYDAARDRAESAARMARASGDYPLLSSGDVNLYSLFVECAMALVRPEGVVGLLTPSGIASDKTAARFFKSVATAGRLRALYDFENRTGFFPNVDSRFKFCVFVASRLPTGESARCAFYLHDVSQIPKRSFSMTAAEFARVNPNTGTAPIFRTRRDAELTTAIYGRLPVLVNRSGSEPMAAWPVTYIRMFDMTNDSGLFRTRWDLEEKEKAWPISGNRYDSPKGEWVPLYEGKMVQAYDHRAASVVVNRDNVHRPAQPVPTMPSQRLNPDWLPDPQYWVLRNEIAFPDAPHLFGFKDVTSPTNARSMIAALVPGCGAGNTFPIVTTDAPTASARLLANFNAVPFDYVARQKIQGQHLNWFIVEQLPVVPPEGYETVRFGPKSAGEIVREAVLELTYTAWDMAPFARDLGHVDGDGEVLPPFSWDEGRRLALRAKLDAVFFHIYGVTERDDVRYVYSTFPIIERQEIAAYGNFRSRELCLAWMNALDAGNPDAAIEL